jgi:hypothetical protein
LKGFVGVAAADNGDIVDVDNIDMDDVNEDDEDESKTDEAINEAYVDVEVVAEGHYYQFQVEPAAKETTA